MGDLTFIRDITLRGILEDAIEYISALYKRSKSIDENALYQQETYRVIILYVISAIEAILFYFYKTRKESMTYTDYKFVSPLLPEYRHSERTDAPVVVAVQLKVEKDDHQIGLHDLVQFFKEKGLVRKETAEDILEMNEVRNTFHFNKPRSQEKVCDIARVEKALGLLLHTIENAPRALSTR